MTQDANNINPIKTEDLREKLVISLLDNPNYQVGIKI